MSLKSAEPLASHQRVGPLGPRSIARHLTLLYVASTGMLLLFAGGYLYWELSRNLDARDRALLSSKVHVLRSLLSQKPLQREALANEVEHEATEGPLRYYLRVLDASGHVQFETPGMEEELDLVEFPPEGDPTAGTLGTFRPSGPFLLVSARTSGGESHILQAAIDTSADKALLSDYRRKLLGVLALGLLFAAVAGGLAAWAGMRPITGMAQVAQRVSASQLDERIVLANWPAELKELADAMNSMLDRLQDSFSRMAQFSGDLAHELRTPIGNLRGEAEVALKRCRTTDEYQQVLGSNLEECERLSRMIDGLLFVARADDPRTALERVQFEATEEIDAICEFYEALANEQEVSVAREGRASVWGDPMLFRRAVGNLLANALRHTPRGGLVTIAAKVLKEGGAEVVVRDSGGGIPAEHLPSLFNRFYRVDSARSGSRGGTGLGLAIVRSIMKLHGGSASMESVVGAGTVVTLRFPAAVVLTPVT